MCGGGGGPGGDSGGYDAVTEGANLVGGSGLGTSTSDSGQGGGWFGEPTTAASLLGLTSEQSTNLSDTVGSTAMPLGFALPVSAIVSEARGAGQEPGVIGDALGDTGPGGTGGPGADPSRIPSGTLTGAPAGPPVAPKPTATTTTGPNIIAPTTNQVSLEYSTERAKNPAEIDSANKLRQARELAYAQQRINAENELLKALSLRDVASNPETRLTEEAPAAVKFSGLPPTLGQSRHRWA